MKRSSILLIMFVWLSTTAIQCRYGPAPVEGERSIPVPHFSQPPQSFWCGPATVQMWEGYAWGVSNVHSQQTIFDWMVSHYPGEASENGVSPRAIAGAATTFVSGAMEDVLYGGVDEQRLALADLSKNIYQYDPVIAIVNSGWHAVIVNGVTWQELETTQPQGDWVIVQDPLRSPRTLFTVGQWRNSEGMACGPGPPCMRSIMRVGRRSFALQELEEFDYLGGVYSGPPPPGATGRYKVNGYGQCYWDPNDSGPDQCSGGPTGRYKWDGSACYWDPNDSGPDQCSPELASVSPRAILTRLLGRLIKLGRELSTRSSRASVTSAGNRGIGAASHVVSGRQDQSTPPVQARTRRHTTVPRPWGTTRDDILANFYAAVRQSRLDRMPGFENLTASNTNWRVRDVIPVASIARGSNYYLLHVTDSTGSIVGAVAVDEEGYLMGYEDSQGLDLPRPLSLDSAHELVRAKMGHASLLGRRYVYAPGSLEPGASRFAPLTRIERPDGDYYVNTGGRVFREIAIGTQVDREGRAGSRQRVLLNRAGVREFSEVR